MLSSNFFQILIIAGIILLALIIIGTILARLGFVAQRFEMQSAPN